MNEKLQYAEMLEIPVSTCSITFNGTKKRKRRKKDHDDVKSKLIEKVNLESGLDLQNNEKENTENAPVQQSFLDQVFEAEMVRDGATPEEIKEIKEQARPNKKRGLSITKIQLAIIGLLLATIIITNALVKDSGINTFIKKTFYNTNAVETLDVRLHTEFNPVVSLSENQVVSLDNGVMTITEGSTYSPCDGKITSIITDENGISTMEITHSENFKTVLSGLDYTYFNVGDTVYKNIPVGYSFGEDLKLCFYDGTDGLITNYTLNDNGVVWAV